MHTLLRLDSICPLPAMSHVMWTTLWTVLRLWLSGILELAGSLLPQVLRVLLRKLHLVAFQQKGHSTSVTCTSQVRRLESQISSAEAQAHTAEEARAELQQELQQLAQTFEEAKVASEQHVEVCDGYRQDYSGNVCPSF